MVGSYDLDACSVCSLDDLLNDLIACEDFNVYHVDKSGLGSLDVDVCIDLILDSLLSALFRSTECHEYRHVAEDLAEALHNILESCEVEYVFKPVDTPFNYVCRKLCDSFCFFKNGLFCYAYDRNADLRHSFADYCISGFNCVHSFIPFSYKFR